MYKKSLATTHLYSRTAVHAPRSCLLSVLRRLLCPSEQRLNLYTHILNLYGIYSICEHM